MNIITISYCNYNFSYSTIRLITKDREVKIEYKQLILFTGLKIGIYCNISHIRDFFNARSCPLEITINNNCNHSLIQKYINDNPVHPTIGLIFNNNKSNLHESKDINFYLFRHEIPLLYLSYSGFKTVCNGTLWRRHFIPGA